MINKKKKKRAIWFLQNEDAKGYLIGDNRVMDSQTERRERMRRTYNL
jgi:hypothetical protein